MGFALDRLWLSFSGPPATTPSVLSRDDRSRRTLSDAAPVHDYSLADSGTILNLVLADWFTNPRHRPEALRLLNDLPSEPSGTPQPALDRVVIDVRVTPEGYVPEIPETPVVLADLGQRPPLAKGELGIWIHRFQRRPDGAIEVELDESNYGYTQNSFTYRARKGAGEWQIEFVCSSLSD